jgi:hypothetical protein
VSTDLLFFGIGDFLILDIRYSLTISHIFHFVPAKLPTNSSGKPFFFLVFLQWEL